MGDFIEQAVTSTATIDLRVFRLSSEKKKINGGFELTGHQVPPEFHPPEDSQQFFNEVVLVREGELRLPKVNVRLTYEDDSTEIREWQLPYDSKWTRWQWQSDVKLKAVFIDPELTVLLDKNLTNNLKQSSSTQNWRWLTSYLQQLQMLTSTLLPL
jgi:hypothetical protein